MCLTIPYQVEKIKNKQAWVSGGKTVDLSLVRDSVEVGDWLLISGGLAITKISNQEAKEVSSFFDSYQSGGRQGEES